MKNNDVVSIDQIRLKKDVDKSIDVGSITIDLYVDENYVYFDSSALLDLDFISNEIIDSFEQLLKDQLPTCLEKLLDLYKEPG